ncbi:LLM class flavin-dependent oxidoreductase [Aureimonas sp. ME7]|uniref:LLM class flavin-dependent oxidoreductase n=1 Tax=Aureimonas sp. ME7 TaxID=2744252 RepID=UPI0015F369EF|nr:LLM class flavin-dependent oxidoreductase [Aureimonas sp. ME7]
MAKDRSRTPMKLGAFLYATGHHLAAWRHQDSAERSGFEIDDYVRFARLAEDAKFDLLFLEDGAGIREPDLGIAAQTSRGAHFEPLSLLAALATQTRHIGLVGTVSTSYSQPYQVARTFASLDHISGGRSGWNLVTSTTDMEARNFSRDRQDAHGDRYARAEEFVDVVRGLWDSYEADALVLDRASGRYFDPAKLHALDHKGRFYSVRGPLNAARSPQGRPVVVQAGSSQAGIDLAARTAEVVFTAAQTLADGQDFYRRLKGRMAHFGRSPDELAIMPGVFPVVGRTRGEAEDKFAELQALTPDAVALALLGQHLGTGGLDAFPLDEPLPADLPATEANKGRHALLMKLSREENLSLIDLARRISGARGHWQVIGTAGEIADVLQERFEGGAADGFNIMPATLPGGLEDFVGLVLPELRRRGLARNEYSGRTLRDNLGLLPSGATP